jgi:hypothetical protein
MIQPYGDLHTRFACRMFNVPYEEVTPQQRQQAKSKYWVYLYQVDGDKVLATLFGEDICARDWTP